MIRGEIVIAVLPGDYGKPRPAVVVQDDVFAALDSIILCPITSYDGETGLLRPALRPDEINGLQKPSAVMIEKINAVSRTRCREIIGRVAPDQLAEIDLGLRLILGHD